MPLRNRSIPRQILYLLLALGGLVAALDLFATWHL